MIAQQIKMIKDNYKTKMRILLDSCDNMVDKADIVAEIGDEREYIVRGNKYVDEYIDVMLDNGYRYSKVDFKDVYDWVLDVYEDEDILEEVARFFVENNIKSFCLDW